MLAQVNDRIINVKSKRGQILRIVRERYLRKDITCKIRGCLICKDEKPSFASDAPYLLIPDVDVLVDYLEIFESLMITGMVIAQTVIEILQDQTQGAKSLVRRLRELTNDGRRFSSVFSNENFEATYYEHPSRQSLKLRPTMALAKLAVWFVGHIAESRPSRRIPVIFLTSHDDAKSLFQLDGVQVMSMQSYLESFWPTTSMELFESVKQVAEERKLQKRVANEASTKLLQEGGISGDNQTRISSEKRGTFKWDEFTEHLSDEVLDAGVKSGLYFKGKLKVNESTKKEAIVTLHEGGVATNFDSGRGTDVLKETSSTASTRIILERGSEVVIASEWLRNRAIHGDIVFVALLHPSVVKARYPQLKDHLGPFGRIIGIETCNWRKYVCTIQLDNVNSMNINDNRGNNHPNTTLDTHSTTVNLSNVKNDHPQAAVQSSATGRVDTWLIAVPWDSKIPKIRIKTRQASELISSRILVSIDRWDVESRWPHGHYVKNLGPIGVHETEMQVLLHEGQVDTTPFAPSLLAELPPPGWRPSLNDPSLGPRRDLTDWRIYSIDPPNCQDIDDALSCRFLEHGNFQIGVHIADVAALVPEGSLIDLEAHARATSVYLADRRIDMLPTMLSERLCSLRVGEPRYAVSVIWEMDSQGKILDTWYGRTLIKTAYEMCYSDAQDILDDRPEAKKKFADFALLRKELLGLQSIFHILRDRRYAKGALELESVEVNFKLDDNKKPKAILTKEALEVHALVAEFMIFANCAVGEYIAKYCPESALLRRHPLPKDENFKELIELAKSRGCDIDTTSNFTLAQSLHKAATLGDRMFTFMLRSLTTFAMSEAQYFSSGSFDEFYHYGLAADYYTHFTSPIRRYADVIVHRELLAILEQQRRIESHKSNTKPQIKPIAKSTASTAPQSYAATATSTPEVDTKIYVQTNQQVQAIADHLNWKNRQAKIVQRNSRELYQTLFFSLYHDPNEVEIGVVASLRHNGIFLYIPKYGFHCILKLHGETSSKPTLFAPGSLPSLNADTAATLKSFELIDSRSKMTLNTTTGSYTVKLFDCVAIKISVESNRAHMASVVPIVVRFETKPFNAEEATTFRSASTGIEAPSHQKGSNVSTPAGKSNLTSTTTTSTKKNLLREVLEAEKRAQKEAIAAKLSQLPRALLEAASRPQSALYQICRYGSDSEPTLIIDIDRILASFVLSRRGLRPSYYPDDAIASNQPSHTRKPVLVVHRRSLASGRRLFKEKEYREALEYKSGDYEDYEEYDSSDRPSNPSIPGYSYGPSKSFGQTTTTETERTRNLTDAAFRAEREFKSDQAQVNKRKFESRMK